MNTVRCLAAAIACLTISIEASWLLGQVDSADLSTSDATDDQRDDLARRAVGLLRDKCWNCHATDKQEGGLRLDSQAYALKGGQRSADDSPNANPVSLLLRSVLGTESGLEMPPKNRLKESEIQLLTTWIEAGLPWPRNSHELLSKSNEATIGNAWVDARNPVRVKFDGQRLDGWSWKPIQRSELPQLEFFSRRALAHGFLPTSEGVGSWESSALDRWFTSRWTTAGLQPAPLASRHAIARRLSLDLTGLPPRPEALETFLRDARPDAYERYVDRLLASPRHGEHVARMWLDVVRYSDSNGFDWDEFRPNAWRYRDYVVRAFNSDLPFDQFVHQQLAGDLLQASPPRSLEEQDCLLATGYLRMGPHDNAAGAFNEQDRSRAELMADLTETTASAFLGQTFACCRCHDHKTEPLLQEDHYRLRAFFAGVEFADKRPIDLASVQEEIDRNNEPWDAQIAQLDKRIQEIEKVQKARKEAARKNSEAKASQSESGSEETDEALSARSKSLKAERKNVSGNRREFSYGLLMSEKDPPPPIHVFYQGDHRAPRQQVVPGFPMALDPGPALTIDPSLDGSTQNQSPRSRLAHWITAKKNPWTARVIVNRLWQLYFGDGLVATGNDFGISGAAPTSAELVDWLASELTDFDWSLKRISRQIVTSSVYRQVVLPGGRQAEIVSARSALRRLSAEQTRDSLLASSGLLQLRSGGPPIWPQLPAEILQANPAFLDDNETKTKGWYPSPENEQSVRSLLLIQKRTVRIPLLETLDLPENSASCARRESSIVAPQALSLMNSSLAAQAAEALALECAAESDGDATHAIREAFRRTLQREPTPNEAMLAQEFLARYSLGELCRSLLNTNEMMFVP